MKKKLVIGIIAGIIVVSLIAAALANPSNAGHRKKGERIGLIYVEGTITGSGEGSGLFGVSASGRTIMEQLRKAQKDDSIKAVLIRINSPGGSSAASQEIGVEVDKLRQSGKIVVASMGDVAASGGYWIAAKADKIIADPATMTGSIGVIMDLQNMQELYEKIGISTQPIKSGPFKDMGSSTRPMTPAERAIFQAMVDDIYQQFVDVVAKGRKMDRKKVLELADGRVFTGRQAKQNGLVDELGNYYDAVEYTAKIAGIKGEPEIYQLGPVSPFEMLLGGAGAIQGLGNQTSNGISEKEIRLIFDLLNRYQQLQSR